MKRILFFVLLTSAFIACEKNSDKFDTDIPKWLQDHITQERDADLEKWYSYGAWLSYMFQGEKYYVYDNPLKSSYSAPYTKEGDEVNVAIWPIERYEAEKCCKKYVWAGTRYDP